MISPHSGGGPLAADEVTVCWLETEAATLADERRWAAILSPGERERAARFHLEADRRDYIGAHALMRRLLSRRLGLPAESWRFLADAGGKPRLEARAGAPEVVFNLSHTRGLVAAALAGRGAIGVDVEEIDTAKADFAVAEACFAPSELALLRRTPEAERPRCFFRLWTLKEAYVKAIGAGLAAPLDSFAFTLQPVRIDFAPAANGGDLVWQFADPPTTDRHVLSVAVGRAPGDAAGLTMRALAPGDV